MKNFKLLQKVEYWKCYLLTAVFFIVTIPVHSKSVSSFNVKSIKVYENEIYKEKLGKIQALIDVSEQGFSNNAIHSIAKVESLIQEFLSKEQVDVTLASIFSASDALDKNSKTQKISTFLDSYRNFSIDKIQIQVRKSEELLGAWAVFAAKGHQGKPVIYLNEKSSQYLTEDQLVRVLLEEMGHWIDFQIHGNLDSPGDEGQLFAAIVQKGSVSEAFKNRLLEENDHLTFKIEGVEITAELASIIFSTADAYAIQTSPTIATTQLETNIVYVKERLGTAGDRVLFVSIPEADPVFSGNNVRGWLYIVEPAPGNKVVKAYLGEVSRLYKTGSTVEGLQFFVYPDQRNEGYLADRQTLSNSILVDIGVKDFTVGNTYGTSSDPVASALNDLLDPDPISAGADSEDALEKGGLNNAIIGTDPSGNVISNDAGGLTNYTIIKTTEPWIMATTSSSVKVSGFTSTLTGITSVVPGPVQGSYGTLTLAADGSFNYVLDNNNVNVQALRLISNTLTETFTYKAFADGQEGVGTLTLTIQGVNDNPIAFDDYNIAKESLLANNNVSQYNADDPLGFKAIGNVLTNDTDVDKNGESFKISGIEAKANVTTISESTTLLFVTIPSNVQIGSFVWSDGDGVENMSTTNASILKDKNGVDVKVVGSIGNSAILSAMPYKNGQPLLLPGGTILGFSNQSNGAGYKEATISGSELKASTFLQVNSQISGGIEAGMTVSGTGIPAGITVTSLTYKPSGAIDRITLSAEISIQSGELTFSNSTFPITTTGKYGKLLLNVDGSYTYTPFAQNPDLNEGQKGQELFPYTMEDALTLKSNAILYIAVTGSGTNDPDAKALTAIAKEAGGVSNGTLGIDPSETLFSGSVNPVPSSTLEINEVRTGNFSKFLTGTPVQFGGTSYNVSISGLYGTLYVQKGGNYIYVVDNDKIEVQQLKTGDVLIENFQYFLSNGLGIDGSTFVITLQGAYDAPIVLPNTNIAIVGSPEISGNILLNDSDFDADDTKVVSKIIAGEAVPTQTVSALSSSSLNPASISGIYGTLKLGADGTYTYAIDVNNAEVQALVSTGSLTEIFTYEVKDAGDQTNSSTLTITIHAPNRAPVNTSPTSVSTSVGASFPFSGLNVISASDVDENLYSVALSVEDGTLSLNDKGTPVSGIYTYVLYGTEAEINVALESLVYTSSSDFSGTDKLTIQSVDIEGLSNTTYVNIDVSATNLVVNNIVVNEATGKAYFTVSGVASQQLKLAVADGTSTNKALSTVDYGTIIEYNNGTAWTVYNTGATISLDLNGKLLVRIPITNDSQYEGAELFRLIAANTNNTDFVGTCTIMDDGTGLIFNEDGTENVDAVKDDDRLLTINNITVNEKSPYAVFLVNGAVDQLVNLSLKDGTALAADYGNAIGTYSGTNWLPYTDKTFVRLDETGNLYVRTVIKDDNLYEGSEIFNLLASNTGGTIAEGRGTIKDDGTGDYWFENSSDPATRQELIDNNIILDDDRLKLFVDKNVTDVNVPVPGSVATNDVITVGTTYGTPIADTDNPAGANIVLKADGTYVFVAPLAGIYYYQVPVCGPGQTADCELVTLQITVIDPTKDDNPAVVNPDIAVTGVNVQVNINVLDNDKSGNTGGKLVLSTLEIIENPKNGVVTINADGTITYLPNHAFIGVDTFKYSICDDSIPASCSLAEVFITVIPGNVPELTLAADDYALMEGSLDGKSSVSGNVLINDSNTNRLAKLSATLVTDPATLPGKLVFNADGSYTFTPNAGFYGPTEAVYQVCDDVTPPSCAKATLYILVQNPDTDGDGVSNAQELLEGTDPTNPCDYKAASQDLTKVSAAWKANDCDKDGLTNNEEATGVNDPSTPADPKGIKTDPIDPDSDGDGVSDGQEALDGTNPNNPCDYKAASQDLTKVDAAWKANDCDKDGLTNNEEATGIDDPSTPANPKGIKTNPLDPDSDGDGVSDGQEALDGTNPNDPCDYKSASQDLTKVSSAWKSIDCDNDGLTNNEELTGVDDPSTPANPKGIKTDPRNPDSDGDGVTDGKEALDGTNPNDPCDYKAASQDLTKVSATWKSIDCDKDGLTNNEEVTGVDDPATPANPKGIKTDPRNPDSDGDGVTDGQEALDGTNPNDPCSFKPASQTLTPSAAWNNGDCDGDGVTNGKEKADGTNPLNGCDLKVASRTLTPSDAWKNGDCDGDGLTNEVDGIDDCDKDGTPNFLDPDTCDIDILLPNVFTPNGDGINDEIKPILLNIQKFVCFKVFNRWGNIIFETKHPEKGWDGSYREADQGTETFQWLAEGYDRNGKLVKLTGMITLLR